MKMFFLRQGRYNSDIKNMSDCRGSFFNFKVYKLFLFCYQLRFIIFDETFRGMIALVFLVISIV
jgi:hypothetical protein